MHACLSEPFLDAPARALSPFNLSADMTARAASGPEVSVSAGPEDQRYAAQQSKQSIARDQPQVLHVGCGLYCPHKLPSVFRGDEWREVRLDIDPAVSPDLIASVTDMHVIADCAMAGVYSADNIEHLYPHEVPLALAEIKRVLTPAGFAYFKLPDLQEAARYIADGNLIDPVYVSSMGPITPMDIVFGHGCSVAGGNLFMAHRGGFTSNTLGGALIEAGFAAAIVQRDASTVSLTAIAFRRGPGPAEILFAQNCLTPDLPAVLYSWSYTNSVMVAINKTSASPEPVRQCNKAPVPG